MQNGGPSRTALGAARYRAEHQVLDAASVFRDPLAVAVAEPGSGHAGFAPGHVDQDAAVAARMRMFIVSRSRFAEDALADAYRAGVRQVVFLGAGLDTFAYRNPHPELRVFEVDHPDTQAWKQQRLAEAQIPIPESVTYVGVDFERQRLEDVLPATGFDPAAPAFFIWLGVTVYLTRPAIATTLRTIAGFAPGTGLVFDYGLPWTPGTPEERARAEARMRRLAAIGEEWVSFFTPEDIAAELREAGLELVEDLAPDVVLARYLEDLEPAAQRPGPHLVRAVVATPAG
ncbi:class I SAM-dependent methyltransferase [Nocardia sp. NPDC020380]|uniref:class I SAM-dependent methyltransferase n=1 Tax=Nocardia sp. NPDC020380 TaxID=3364309 RepID=UPI0037B45604